MNLALIIPVSLGILFGVLTVLSVREALGEDGRRQ